MTKAIKPITVVDKRGTDTHVGAAAPAPEAPRPLPEKRQLSPSEIEAAMAFHYAEGRTTATVHEIYKFGLPLWCFLDGKPNCALVRPIRRPEKSAGGIIEVIDEKRGTLGTNALVYLVLALGDEVETEEDHPDTYLNVKPGDVVVLRNAMLEPLDDTLNTLSIHRSHVLSKVDVSGH